MEIMYSDSEKRAVIPFRKFWSGYLKGFFNASKLRQELMKLEEYTQIEDLLLNYLMDPDKYNEVQFIN